jgi:hypothetical protein
METSPLMVASKLAGSSSKCAQATQHPEPSVAGRCAVLFTKCSRDKSLMQIIPVFRKDVGGKKKTNDDIHQYADAEGGEGFSAGAGQIAKACRQANAEKAEDEYPGPQIFQRPDQEGGCALIILRQRLAA